MKTTLESQSTAEINFDFRFDPSPENHKNLLEIRQELIKKYLSKEFPKKIRKTSLYPVSRAGKSGSEVFYLDIFQIGHEKPLRKIAKFQSIEKTDEEVEGANTAMIAQFCQNVAAEKHPSQDLGIIVYNLASALDHVEFRGYFLDLSNSNKSCAEALNSIFQSIGKTSNNEAERKTLVKDYDWYVNRKNKPLHRLTALSKSVNNQDGLAELAKNIEKDYSRILEKYDMPVYPYSVHGDLHARNLMLSKSNPAKTELIDFGWVHAGHPAKDFVLMECTLKYMLLPELLQAGRSAEEGNLYYDAKHLEFFEAYLNHCNFDLPAAEEMMSAVFKGDTILNYQKECIVRTYQCLVEVRKAAGEVLMAYCKKHQSSEMTHFQHYTVGLFLVTLGLLEMPELDRLSAMIGLRSLGEYL